MRIGKYEVKVITSGKFALDGGAMFGVIPRPLWERTNPPDAKNRISLVTRNVLLVSDSKKVLIDTGMGKKWDEKSQNIYDISLTQPSLEENLNGLGYSAGDITDVLLTHLHFDHTGGSTKSENGNIVPTFSNAKYHISAKNLRWALDATERDQGSYLKENFIPLLEAGVLNPMDENIERIDEEIGFIQSHGHTYGQQLFKISDGSTTFNYGGELFPTSSHIPLPYIMGYDLQPLVTLQEKKAILPTAVDEEWLLIFEHDPFCAAAKVKLGAKGFYADGRINDL